MVLHNQVLKTERVNTKTMKKQGYNSRMDESLGMRNGKKSQSMKSRRDESKAMNKKSTGKAYSSVKTMGKKK